jgi:hypothetical protein
LKKTQEAQGIGDQKKMLQMDKSKTKEEIDENATTLEN